MKRCPQCGSGAERKNLAAGIAADIAGFGAGIFGTLFGGPAGGRITQRTVSKELCENAEYQCTNPKCGYFWTEKREV